MFTRPSKDCSDIFPNFLPLVSCPILRNDLGDLRIEMEEIDSSVLHIMPEDIIRKNISKVQLELQGDSGCFTEISTPELSIFKCIVPVGKEVNLGAIFGSATGDVFVQQNIGYITHMPCRTRPKSEVVHVRAQQAWGFLGSVLNFMTGRLQ